MKAIKYPVKYNSQRDNFDFDGKFKGYQQCFSSSVWMLLGYLCPEEYDGSNDDQLKVYVDDVSNKVGSPGVGEEIFKKIGQDPKYNSAYFWEVHKAAMIKYLSEGGKNGTVVYLDANCTWDMLYSCIEKSPVVLGTDKMAGLPGGHIILVVGVTAEGDLICHDPYGDANTGYKEKKGEYVVYRKDWITPFIGKNHIRCMYYY